MTIVASQAGTGTLPAVTPLPQFCQPETPGAATSFCVEGTPGAEGYAFVNLPVDPDGFLREANLFTAGTPPAVSFPLMLAQQYAGAAIKPGRRDYAVFLGRKIWYADPELKTVLIGSWGRSPATAIPAWKLLEGKVDAAELADKLVLIGQSSDAAKDTHFTPLFRVGGKDDVRQSLGGTQVQAARHPYAARGHVRPPGGALVALDLDLCRLPVGRVPVIARRGWHRPAAPRSAHGRHLRVSLCCSTRNSVFGCRSSRRSSAWPPRSRSPSATAS